MQLVLHIFGYFPTRTCVVQGMSLVPAVTELMLAELMYLQYDNPTKPVFMYINSAGVQVSEAFMVKELQASRMLHFTSRGMVRACEGLSVLQKGAETLGYEFEALAIYDLMRYVKPPIYTVCVGNAFGEAAMLLAAGEKVRHCCCRVLDIDQAREWQWLAVVDAERWAFSINILYFYK